MSNLKQQFDFLKERFTEFESSNPDVADSVKLVRALLEERRNRQAERKTFRIRYSTSLNQNTTYQGGTDLHE